MALPPTSPPAGGAPDQADHPEQAGPSGPASPRRRRGATGWLSLLLVAVLGGSVLFVSGFLLGRQAGATPGTPLEQQTLFEPFWDAYHAIVQSYVGTVDQRALVEAAIKGMFGTLGDPFSFYLSPSDLQQTLSGLSPQFVGIGATMTSQDPGDQTCSPFSATCRLVVVSTVFGAPADKAGLQAGDRVLAIDGSSVDGLTIDQAVARIRGTKGTPVTLQLQRGSAAPFQVTMTRQVIAQPAVESRVLANGKVGYLHLDGFTSSAAPEFERQLKALVDQGLTRIVFDLRGDGGGYVDAAQAIASQFIASGPIFWYEYAGGRKVAQMATPGGIATDPRLQLVVLIDKNSASASEIVAGALQDTGRARLIGSQSYGKGTIQQFQMLPDGMGGFRLSIARWLTPKGRSINKVGLTPDIPVTVPPNLPAGQDPVLQKALDVLLGTSATLVEVAA